MDLRQRKRERKRWGNRQDRKERGMDYQELGREECIRLRDGRWEGGRTERKRKTTR